MADGVQNARDLFLDMSVDLEPCENIRLVFSEVLNDGGSVKRGPVGLTIEDPVAESILRRPVCAWITIQDI